MTDTCDICGTAPNYIKELSRMRGNNFDIVTREYTCKCQYLSKTETTRDNIKAGWSDIDGSEDRSVPSRWGT